MVLQAETHIHSFLKVKSKSKSLFYLCEPEEVETHKSRGTGHVLIIDCVFVAKKIRLFYES